MGTPEFAVPSLKMLIEQGHEIEVFTQPDRPRDRGHGLAMPPVKIAALEAGLVVHQFERIKSDEGVLALKAFAPELMVTAAFGQILSQENLDIPKYGCINVHGSLLPAYRGASPVQSAIINGEKVTGVTTMLTDIGMDTGDMLLRRETEIGENETYGELYARLALIGAELLRETLERLADGTLTRTKQDDALATKCTKIKKENTCIDFSMPSQRIHDLVRGVNPAPCAFAVCAEQKIKIIATRIIEKEKLKSILENANAVCGECLIADSKRGLVVRTGDGAIEITELQFPNAKRMSAKAALNSKKLLGCVFNEAKA